MRVEQITRMAATECGSEDQTKLWLLTPKVAFQGRAPIEMMVTLEGCDAVEKLLEGLNR